MIDKEKLLKEAFVAMNNAYAPYSNYHVGACLLCKDGRTFKGCNIENCSYGATNCGERTAVFAAYGEGYRKEDFLALAIVSDGNTVATPCGICRQVLIELLDKKTPIILSNGKKTIETDMEELLPFNFSQEDLK